MLFRILVDINGLLSMVQKKQSYLTCAVKKTTMDRNVFRSTVFLVKTTHGVRVLPEIVDFHAKTWDEQLSNFLVDINGLWTMVRK